MPPAMAANSVTRGGCQSSPVPRHGQQDIGSPPGCDGVGQALHQRSLVAQCPQGASQVVRVTLEVVLTV